ncbi:transposon Ty3-I Gag-Pol polyprotein [Nephila pilipes]|uniref:Transposon Ty3-I Gag-Pol polyprotein n=1 Tax=Nephila pilipes TaxID=299642 RepID=A0A8X6NYY4_NEPPI|nr:transposon Ty3-I Gag-Pol polyprotein [Nephila pilipes]
MATTDKLECPSEAADSSETMKVSSLGQRIEELHFHRQSNERNRNVEKYNRSSFRSRSRSRKRYDPKAESKLAISSAADELNNCREFNYRPFVFDRKTGIKFLADSGADVSLIPASCGDKVIGDFKLYDANGTEIPCFGHKILTLDLGLRRDFQWPFIIAKVNKGILVADFLNRFNLLIDIKNKKLIDSVTKLSIIGEITSSADELNVSTLNKNNKFSDILAQYPERTKPDLQISKTKHNVEHYITIDSKPIYSKPRQLDKKN